MDTTLHKITHEKSILYEVLLPDIYLSRHYVGSMFSQLALFRLFRANKSHGDEIEFTWKLLVLAKGLRIERLQVLVARDFDRIIYKSRSMRWKLVDILPSPESKNQYLKGTQEDDEALCIEWLNSSMTC